MSRFCSHFHSFFVFCDLKCAKIKSRHTALKLRMVSGEWRIRVEKLRFSKWCRSFGTREVSAAPKWSVLLRKTAMFVLRTSWRGKAPKVAFLHWLYGAYRLSAFYMAIYITLPWFMRREINPRPTVYHGRSATPSFVHTKKLHLPRIPHKQAQPQFTHSPKSLIFP